MEGSQLRPENPVMEVLACLFGALRSGDMAWGWHVRSKWSFVASRLVQRPKGRGP